MGTALMYLQAYKDESSYALAAFDSCGNDLLDQNDLVCIRPIVLSGDYDPCSGIIQLNWTPYYDFVSGIDVTYKIWRSEDQSPFELLGEIKSLNYKDNDRSPGHRYCYKVQAIENEGQGPFTASSAPMCLETKGLIDPDTNYLSTVTVNENEDVKIHLFVDTAADIGAFWIQRRAQTDQDYKFLYAVPFTEPPTPADLDLIYVDPDAAVQQYSYSYVVEVLDQCGSTFSVSNEATTILLEVIADEEQGQNLLRWNKYKEWAGDVVQYRIYRRAGDNPVKLIEQLHTVSMSGHDQVKEYRDHVEYMDELNDVDVEGNGEYCYYIQAIEGSPTLRGRNGAHSNSNQRCVAHVPILYVPSSFTPNGDGVNDVFLPVGVNTEIENYNLSIFNRWGERIFQSHEVTHGWDGTFSGKPVPNGMYTYQLSYNSVDGRSHSKAGNLALIK